MRPEKKINIEQLRKLMVFNPTAEEVAGFFNCSSDSITRKIKNLYNCSFIEYKKRNNSKKTIRKQFFEELNKMITYHDPYDDCSGCRRRLKLTIERHTKNAANEYIRAMRKKWGEYTETKIAYNNLTRDLIRRKK
jgi:predicted transcriptional regulator